MENATYFQRQAERCFRLARRCFDLDVAEQLNAMGDEFLEKAREHDRDQPAIPVDAIKSNGRASDGGIGHA